MRRLVRLCALPLVVALAASLAACGGGAVQTTAGLSTADTSAGTAVVDADGRAVYVYTRDTPDSGRSACSGECAATWPAVTVGSGAIEVADISAKVDVMHTSYGTDQLTLDGWPLYYFDGDTAPGMIKGQGIGGVWWLVGPDGTQLTDIGR